VSSLIPFKFCTLRPTPAIRHVLLSTLRPPPGLDRALPARLLALSTLDTFHGILGVMRAVTFCFVFLLFFLLLKTKS
jgi:hypothetical protein